MNSLGAWGEAVATDYLEKQGCRILSRNYTCRYGELDLVAQQGEFLLFVEVKARSGRSWDTPAQALTRKKQEKLLLAAQTYLQEHPTTLQPRFDLIQVFFHLEQGTPKLDRVDHLPGAFDTSVF